MENNNALSMKWHKFLIYFALWASGIMNAVNGARMMTGAQYGSTDVANQVYALYGSLKSVDTVFGILLVALGIYLIYTRFQLAGFKAGAPGKLTVGYILSLVVSLGYYLVAASAIKVSVSDVMDSSTVASMAVSIVMIFANRAYYAKRAHLFGEGVAESASESAYTASTATSSVKPSGSYCPKCGARVEPDDAFCVNCGTKLK